VEKSTLADVTVVIVSWNVRRLLERCLSSLLAASERSSLSCTIIVVDNASTDGSADMVRQRFPGVQLVASDANLGFSRGNNLGIARSKSQYVLLLNPDTEVVGDALSMMVAYLEHHDDVGALGPRLVFPDGRTQSSRRRFPTLATVFLESTLLQQWFPRSAVLSRYYVLDRGDDEVQDVDWLVGACLLIRRQVWEQVGPLDEAFFMYSEELD